MYFYKKIIIMNINTIYKYAYVYELHIYEICF